jgi:hypothetical protein
MGLIGEEVDRGFYPALNLYSAFDLTYAGLWKSVRKGAVPTVKAAVEVSVLLRRECEGV